MAGGAWWGVHGRGMCGRERACVTGKMVIAVGGTGKMAITVGSTHPTGMHSCFK